MTGRNSSARWARPAAALGTAALAAGALATPEQITNSMSDSEATLVGAAGSGLVVIESTGDLTPGQSGNSDGTREVYLMRLADLSVRQVTASDSDSSARWVSERGQVVVTSDGDLTPAAPGNGDGTIETWVYRPGTRMVSASLTQMSSSDDDTTFRVFWEEGGRVYLTSNGDLTPGAPGNGDQTREVWAYDIDRRVLEQVTNTDENSTFRAICERSAVGVVDSRGNLAPGAPGNTDGSREIYLVDLRTLEFKQVTSSGGDTRYAGQDATGRLLAFESDGDLTPADADQPGNADGSQEVYVYDRKTKRLRQMTHSLGDASFAGFVPHKRMIAVESTRDLVPATADTPGNADLSREVFTVHLVRGRVQQETASAGDSSLAGFAGARSSLAAITSDGDLDGGTAAVGVDQVFLRKLGAKRGETPRRLTFGATASTFRGFDPSGRAIAFESRADLVPVGPDAPGNADLSREVFVARTSQKPQMRQLTASTEDSSFAGFTGDGRTLIVNSRGSLDPSGPGNADGSLEVFRIRYR